MTNNVHSGHGALVGNPVNQRSASNTAPASRRLPGRLSMTTSTDRESAFATEHVDPAIEPQASPELQTWREPAPRPVPLGPPAGADSLQGWTQPRPRRPPWGLRWGRKASREERTHPPAASRSSSPP